MRRMMLTVMVGVIGGVVPAMAAPADNGAHIISAFAITRPGDVPARVIEYYGLGQNSRVVQQPPLAVARRQPQRG